MTNLRSPLGITGLGRSPARGLAVLLVALATSAPVGPRAAAAPGEGTEPAALHHLIWVEVDPAKGSLAAIDEISGAAIGDEVVFSLHAALEVQVEGRCWVLVEIPVPGAGPSGGIDHRSEEDAGVPRRTWRARRSEEGTGAPLVLSYSGVIAHAVAREGEEYARSFSSTPGIISEEGVALGAAAAWVPELGDRLFTYELRVELPEGWDAVSQGDRVLHARDDRKMRVTWRVATPTEEVHLIAGRYHEWTRATGGAEAQVFLRSADESLAAKYLEVTAQYLAMYSELIGPYPYGKFALVENFWETGYGMPSFTLLGPQVIRLPFILHSSYPHEILHNWWGNSVYVDFEGGNWCEGLTAYLADHLVKEGLGQGEEYRRDVLEKYRSYVGEGHEISLAEFRSRHSGATEAVGYGKSLMLWHMLRRDLGDEKFVAALRRLYQRHRYERVSFAMIERIFSETSGRDLAPWFAQWVERKGAPELALQVVPPAEAGADWQIAVEQVQEEEPYRLSVPVAVLPEGSEALQTFTVPLTDPSGAPLRRGAVSLGSPPRWVAVDPSFDLFRRLHAEEVQPSLGDLFGAPRALVVLPAGDGEPDWAAFASAWDPDGERLEVVGEAEIESLPADRPVWILGRDNRHAAAVRDGARARGAELAGERFRFGAESVPAAGHAFAVVERHPADPALAIGWIAADLEGALPGLARKLPHYGKYSYLVFAGEEPANVIKGEWPSDRSPLVWRAPGFDGPAPAIPEREPLARLAPVFDPAALLAHVRALADPALEGRAAGSEGAARSAAMIAEAFRAAGLAPGGAGESYIDEWTEEGPAGPLTLRNVIGVLPGTRAELTGAVVIGAHYDHLGRGWPDVRAGEEGKIHPGADDNASGVAVLIEVARLLAGSHRPARPIVFIAFDGEEWDRRGSKRYASSATAHPARDALAMISLDAVGRLGEKKLLVLGTGTASEWIHVARGIGFTTGIESTAAADDPGGSDQVSFHEVGVPAVQLTSGPNEDYHRPSDTADKIDAAGMVKIATWLREAVVYLGDRAEPLTSGLAGGAAPAPATGGAGRRVSLGTVPDFADPGPGVRVESVLPGSPAEKAGLRGGDRIVSIGGRAVADLRAYSEILKGHAPGDTIAIELERAGEKLRVEATLVAR